MKKIMFTMAVALMMTGAVFAQSSNKQGEKPTQEQMAQRMTERMVSAYGLSDAQKTKLLALNKKYAGKFPMGGQRGGRRNGQGKNGNAETGVKTDAQTGATRQAMSQEERTKRRQEMQANREAYTKELKAIFTDAQYQKYTENEKNRRQQRREGSSTNKE